MDQNQIKGTGKDAVGKLKDAAGGLTGDVGLQAEGKVDQVAGKAQKQFGNAADQVKDGVQAVADKASELAGQAQDNLADVADKAQQKTSEFTSQAQDKASDLAGSARKGLDDAASTSREAASDFAARTTNLSHRANEYVGQTVQRQPLLSLLGIGALAYLVAFLVHSPASPLTPETINIRRR